MEFFDKVRCKDVLFEFPGVVCIRKSFPGQKILKALLPSFLS